MLGNRSLELLHYPGYGRGELCSPVLIGIDGNDEMNMIRHDTILINPNSIIHGIQLLNFFIYDYSNIRQGHIGGRTQFAPRSDQKIFSLFAVQTVMKYAPDVE